MSVGARPLRKKALIVVIGRATSRRPVGIGIPSVAVLICFESSGDTTPTKSTSSFSFFQAEDGIRDLYVTGVQTCALPIFARVLQRIQAEVAEYRRLPVEELNGEIAVITRQALRAFCRSLLEDRPLNAAELRQIGASAGRRAEEGFPLEAVLTAYHVGAREIFAVGVAA